MTNVVPIERQNELPPAPMVPLTPMAMISQAIAQGADLSMVQQLMDLQDRHDAKLARKAFDAALAAAKSEIPVIRKNRSVGYKSRNGGADTSYVHEDLGEVARTVDPVLAKHGLSYRFRPEQRDGRVRVTCVLSHVDGHNEESTLEAGADNTGNKNSIQAVGSTITYLQRYTLKMALGLAASQDDDGKASEDALQDVVTDAQAGELRRLIQESGANIDSFLTHFGSPSVSDFPAEKYQDACKTLRLKMQRAAKDQANG